MNLQEHYIEKATDSLRQARTFIEAAHQEVAETAKIVSRTKRWVIAAVILAAVSAVLSAFTVGRATAAPLTELQAKSIYAVAYGQYKGPREWLDKQPNIYLVDQVRICDIAMLRPTCNVLGISIDGVVYIRADLDFSSTFAAGILLHEYVHHFQWLDGKQDAVAAAVARGDDSTACALWSENERQAYEIQIHVLEKAGDFVSARQARSVMGNLHCN